MTWNFQELIQNIIKFLIDVDILFGNRKLKKNQLYFVPLKKITKELCVSKENILSFINERKLGLVYVNDSDKISKIRKQFLEICSKNSGISCEFSSAFDVYSEISSSDQNSLQKDSQINNDFRSHNNHKLGFFHKKLQLNHSDFDDGFIQITNIPLFIEETISFVNLDDIMTIFDWKNFEEFIASILRSFGFKTTTNFRFSLNEKAKADNRYISKTTKKKQNRFEIDIAAINNRTILFIDAKFWMRKTDVSSGLSMAGNYQQERCRNFSNDQLAIEKFFDKLGKSTKSKYISQLKKKQKKNEKLDIWIYPLIVYSGFSSKKLSNLGVPIISIKSFPQFMETFSENKNLFIRYKLKNISLQSTL